MKVSSFFFNINLAHSERQCPRPAVGDDTVGEGPESGGPGPTCTGVHGHLPACARTVLVPAPGLHTQHDVWELKHSLLPS